MSNNQESNVVSAPTIKMTAQEAFKCMSLQAQREQFENFLAQVYHAQPKYVLLVNDGSCSVHQSSDGHFYLVHNIIGQDIHLTDIEEFITPYMFMMDGCTFECQLLSHILPHTK